MPNRARALHPDTQRVLFAVALALFAQALMLLDLPHVAQAVAVLVWAGLAPGWLLVTALVGRSIAPPAPTEAAVYTVGAGFGCLIGALLLLSYLPGPLAAWQLYLASNGLILALALWALMQPAQPGAAPRADLPALAADRRWLLAGLAVLLGVAALLRLLNLGYAEFHGDEARAALRAAAVIQGYEDVLLLHKKGPGEILTPTAIFAATNHLTETSARLPFALANLAALVAVWLLGARLIHPLAGWAAAMLLAVDGYFIGFSRIVQYQSLVILTSALVLLVLARLVAQPHAATRYLSLAALIWAAGLWSHYEAALIAAPALYLVAVLLRRHGDQARSLWAALGVAVAVGAVLLALFYGPFVLHTQFGATYTYLAERRIGGDPLPTNNVVDFFIRTTTYSSTYYILFLIALTVAALVAVYRRSLGPRWGLGAGLLLVAGLAVTAWQTDWLALGGRDWLALFVALALLPAWLLRGTRYGERTLWVWFGVNLILLLFFTTKPRTHVYVFFTPWALLAGMALQRGWSWLTQRAGRRAAVWAGGAAALLLTALFGVYVFLLFAYTRVEVLRNWQTHWPPGYWTVYDVLDNRALFGFPLRNGWKAAGILYQDGVIAGDYATNEVEFWAPLWYTRGQLRCEDEAAWFFQIDNPQPDPEGYRRALGEQLAKEYAPWGTVTVDGAPRLLIHARGADAGDLRVFPLEAAAAAFDAQATPDLPLGYPVVEPPIAHPLDINFGDGWNSRLITLEGYDLAYDAPLEPGETFTLTLYWRAQQEIPDSYKVFNQSYYGDGVMVAQQDGYPVCGSRGTWLWDPGDLVADVHRITVKPDAPPGLYPLYTGLYIEETLERLDVLDEHGAPIADQVHLTDLRIGAE